MRRRLTIWYALILTAGFVLFGGWIWLSLRSHLLDEVDQDLAGRASRFEKYLHTEAAETTSDEQLRDELDEFCQALPPLSYVDLRGKTFAFRHPSASGGLRMLHRRFDGFDLDVGTSIEGVEHTLNLLRLLLFSLSPMVIVIACAGGWWLSGRALKPVEEVTAAALNISIENLSERLPVPATGDELARLTNVLNMMLTRLEAAVKTLSQFVADASHEFRTPLAVIRTNAELALRRDRTNEEYRHSLREVAAEAERMTGLVEDLLILARSDTGASDMPLSPLDLSAVLKEVIAEMSGLADQRNIQVRPVLDSGKAMVSGNKMALRRLFLILLDNALKYSKDGSEVIVTLSGNSITIQDFGAGIHESDLPNIFKRFYQADRARNEGGYGLGLSLAESIAKAHGGSIRVLSAPGAGSSFIVDLRDTVSVRDSLISKT